MNTTGKHKSGIIIEGSLSVIIILALAELLYECFFYGYAVQPFIYDTFDTFMDWFNTAFWAWDPRGAYETWGTVYPPLSFVFLRLVTTSRCYLGSPADARDCDLFGQYSILAIYVLAVSCCALIYFRQDRRTAIFRTIAIALGLPMLFALERGNLVIIALPFLMLGVGPLLRNARLKWLSLAVAINFKIYLIATLATFFAKRKWVALEITIIATVSIYIISWITLGSGTILQLINDLILFSSNAVTHTWQDVYYASSLGSLNRLLSETPLGLQYVGSKWVELSDFAVPLLVRCSQILIVLAILLCWLRPQNIPPFRIAALGIALAITTNESGGYTHILVISLVFLESFSGILRKVSIISAYILCIPNDIIISYIIHVNQYSWWVGHDVYAQYGVSVGNIARPLLMLIISYCLSLLIIGQSGGALWRDFKERRIGDYRAGEQAV